MTESLAEVYFENLSDLKANDELITGENSPWPSNQSDNVAGSNFNDFLYNKHLDQKLSKPNIDPSKPNPDLNLDPSKPNIDLNLDHDSSKTNLNPNPPTTTPKNDTSQTPLNKDIFKPPLDGTFLQTLENYPPSNTDELHELSSRLQKQSEAKLNSIDKRLTCLGKTNFTRILLQDPSLGAEEALFQDCIKRNPRTPLKCYSLAQDFYSKALFN